MVSDTKTIHGSSVHYWVHNPQLQQTVIVVHGFRGNHKSLTKFAYSIQNYRVIMLDLPGHGKSSDMNIPHTLTNFAKCIDSFASTLGIDNFYLWGHSFGASICIEYAALYPTKVKKLVLVSPAISSTGILAYLGTLYYKTAKILPPRLKRSWLASPIVDRISGELLIKGVSRKRKRQLILAGKRNLLETNPRVIVESSLSYLNTDLNLFAKKIKSETLVIAGRLDKLMPISRIELLLSYISNVRFKVIVDHGHLAPIEEPARIASITEEFFAD